MTPNMNIATQPHASTVSTIHPPTLRLRGKVAVVTGSSSGLGRAISLAYAREGARLVCADLAPNARAEVSDELSAETHEEIRRTGGVAVFVKTDVSQAVDVEAMIAKAVEVFGRIDILVNNAGVSLEAGQPPFKVHETPEDWWDKTMAINAKSVFLGCKYAAAQMLKQDLLPSTIGVGEGERGWIVNISSIFGLVGGYHVPTYAASKGAVSNLTRQVALDYAQAGIRCNAICPGYTETAIFVNTIKTADADNIRGKHPLGVGVPADLTGAAIFLASSEARWITGACLPVDGGFTAH